MTTEPITFLINPLVYLTQEKWPSQCPRGQRGIIKSCILHLASSQTPERFPSLKCKTRKGNTYDNTEQLHSWSSELIFQILNN